MVGLPRGRLQAYHSAIDDDRCRRDEIGGLQWSEVDLECGLLSIPGARTKNHHALNLTLPAAAVSILRIRDARGPRLPIRRTWGRLQRMELFDTRAE